MLLNRSVSKISVNDPFMRAGVLVFSDEEWILKLAEQVLKGKTFNRKGSLKSDKLRSLKHPRSLRSPIRWPS